MKMLLTSFLLPPGLFVLISLVALFFIWRKRQRVATVFLAIAVVFGWGMSTEAFGRWITAGLIAQVDARSVEPQQIDMVVVLSAGMQNMGIAGWLPTNESFKRMAVALEIQQRVGSRVPVLVSGGRTHGTKHPSEAKVMMGYFDKRNAQITPMIAEEISTNTYENALQSAHIINRREARNVLLVTSEEHMWRALAAFRGRGIDPIPFPVFTIERRPLGFADYLPSIHGATLTYRAFYEIAGVLSYIADDLVRLDDVFYTQNNNE
jgi:uncharacterized SAM-binding protein YcdF (DUF218 family)